MLAALTRAVSPTLAACELTWLPRQEIDTELAVRQHHEYECALAGLGLRVISLPAQPEMPDAMFVEDPVLVLEEIAIINRMGCASRMAEAESLAAAIAPYRPLHRMTEPATLEGGDVMRIGRDLFVGLSTRTSQAGITQLRAVLDPFGYQVHAVAVRGCLHLKSAVCSIGDGKVLANPSWLDVTALGRLRVIAVPDEEPGAANVLRIGNTVLMPDCFPHAAELIRQEGLRVRTIDISELIKAEAAITCSSVVFAL